MLIHFSNWTGKPITVETEAVNSPIDDIHVNINLEYHFKILFW